MSATIVKMPEAPSPPNSPVRAAHTHTDAALAKPYVVNKAVRKTKCRGSRNTCANGLHIEKGELRLGTRADVDGREQVFWRHVECVTKRMLTSKSVTPDTLDEFIDFCTDDGTKMAIDADETQNAREILCAILSGQKRSAPPPLPPASSPALDVASLDVFASTASPPARDEPEEKRRKVT